MDVETPSGIGIQIDQYGMESFKRVLSAVCNTYLFQIVNFSPNLLDRKPKKKACLGGIKTYIVCVCTPRAAKWNMTAQDFYECQTSS